MPSASNHGHLAVPRACTADELALLGAPKSAVHSAVRSAQRGAIPPSCRHCQSAMAPLSAVNGAAERRFWELPKALGHCVCPVKQGVLPGGHGWTLKVSWETVVLRSASRSAQTSPSEKNPGHRSGWMETALRPVLRQKVGVQPVLARGLVAKTQKVTPGHEGTILVGARGVARVSHAGRHSSTVPCRSEPALHLPCRARVDLPQEVLSNDFRSSSDNVKAGAVEARGFVGACLVPPWCLSVCPWVRAWCPCGACLLPLFGASLLPLCCLHAAPWVPD